MGVRGSQPLRATLKVKASIWGGIAGLIPVVLGIVLFFSQQG